MLISVHIPKTAGTTFRHYLEQAFPGSVLGDYGLDTMEVSALFEGCFEEILKIKDSGYFRIRLISEGVLRLKDALTRKGIQVIHGHFPVAKYLGIFPTATYAAWLRDPLDRALSHYHFQRRVIASPGDEVNRQVYEGRLSFEQWMNLEENVNLQQRFIGSDLDNFHFVGIVEQFNACLQAFFQLLGLAKVTYVEPVNLNPEKPAEHRYEVKPGIKERFVELNRADMTLYQEAVVRVEHSRGLRSPGVPPAILTR